MPPSLLASRFKKGKLAFNLSDVDLLFTARDRVFPSQDALDQWLADHNIPIGSYYVLFGNKSVWGYVQEQPLRRVKARMMGLPVAKPVIGGARGVSSRQSVELVPDK